jgi:hypothetical protein
VSELYQPSDYRLSAKLVNNPHSHILGILDKSCYFFFQVAPQLYSQGWVVPVPDHYYSENLVVPRIKPGNFGSVAKNSEHYTFRSVAVNTWASHVQGPWFDPGFIIKYLMIYATW